MQLAIPGHHQTPLLTPIHPISRPRPIEQPRKPPLPHIPRLHLHRTGHIITHKPAIPTHTIRRHGLLIQKSQRALPREVRVLKRAFAPTTMTSVMLVRTGSAKETPAVARDPQ